MRFAVLLVIVGCGSVVKQGVHKPTLSLPLSRPSSPTSLPPELLNNKATQTALRNAFLISPGDRIQIRVVGHKDLQVEAVVPANGEISFPGAGRIKVVGHSPQEIENTIATGLRGKEFVDPQVVVTITSLAPRRVFILGAVKRPGGYETLLARPLTLVRLIALAGGFLNAADKEILLLVRRTASGDERYIIPFSTLHDGKKNGSDILLLPGDVVIVREQQKVYVLGSIASPGGYVVQPGLRLTHVLALAGGLTRLADPKRVRLIRRLTNGSVGIAVVDIDQVFEGKVSDVVVQPGDVIFVPESLF
ncbi:MAG: hypothetical protein DRP63_09720 [Planctomycetota bacterium]|nr:MAG: hypothetical protein DRP63_09720 [Planctomycetota bacterium]